MSLKTLTELRASVRTLYGDPDGITATDDEVDSLLQDGVVRVLHDCPWINVTLDADEDLTTDASGAASLTHNVEQMYSVEVERVSGRWERIENVHPGVLNVNVYDVTSVDSITGYYLDGNRIQFYPMYRSDDITIRFVYSSNGFTVPANPADTLGTSIPVAAEEAAIRHAVARLHTRDNNLEAAAFVDQDCEGWIQRLKVQHNRPERGESITVYDRTAYSLEFDI